MSPGRRGAASAFLLTVATATIVATPHATAAPPPAALIVTPADDLVDGQSVTVTGMGFTPNASAYVLECSSTAPESGSCDITTLLVVQTGADGGLATGFTVHTGPNGDGVCNAQHSCYMVATTDPRSTDPSQTATAPITFSTAEVVATKTVAAVSERAVRPGQRFSITGTVTAKGKAISGLRVLLYNKRGMKYDRVGSKAIRVAHATTKKSGLFRFRLRGLSQTAHYIVEMPQTRRPGASYLLSVSEVLTVH